MKFSEDLVPLADLKVNPGHVVTRVTEAHQPVVLTRRGRRLAVLQSVAEYDRAEEERAFMRSVVEGLADLEAGREIPLEEARKKLGLD
ncbi:MAG: type II toxin-antitoxin system prevent-host-death family antitoxin [Aquisalimonadaceae bacterium]